MSQYTREQLAEILAEHRKWRLGDGGKRANLSGADLSCANLGGAYLSGADLSGANLGGAYLSGAILNGANLSGAYLSGAILNGANLSGADLSGAILNGEKILTLVARANRSDGYEFIAFATDAKIVIRAGCRTFSLAEYRAHVAAEYPDTDKAIETLDILDFIELRANRAAHRAGKGGVMDNIPVHPVQTPSGYQREPSVCPQVVTMRAYEVYCQVFGPQERMVTGNCRGGFSSGELIAFLYARSFPKGEWSKRVDEALRGARGL